MVPSAGGAVKRLIVPGGIIYDTRYDTISVAKQRAKWFDEKFLRSWIPTVFNSWRSYHRI